MTRLQTLTTVAQGRGWMRQHRRGGHVLLFVHGYNTTYGEAVYRFAQSGEIPAFKLGGTWRFRRSELEQWIDQNSNQRAPAKPATATAKKGRR